MSATMQLDIVSAEGEIFSGKVDRFFAQAANGEVGVLPHHTQFITTLKPGEVRVMSGDEVSYFYVSGGVLEIQPDVATVLADSALRAKDLDEAAAQEAMARAQEAMDNAKTDLDVTRAQNALAEAAAQIAMLGRLRDQLSKQGLMH
ncbi:MAG: F0F1 ATP synthase subunit epsilon [Thiotrichales bacterium 32-46-8]|jgi:F-type H+-transporting ATPase subunit epsilon|nr:MAG: F0F1 ATP synthase subunit epsilon [Thiotrichales bacterium 32-46-8]OYY25526.1 MAG: F0F1 ATP synthase subunit epsilon [Thiotrichales bacterium 35-46-9]OYZ08125.1 MAG: F0F1 ATP synthase subunit epsilon [Thiotrichales bacterium 16-46-22]OYZ39749.1 MAG: F0F1 ATP synthase subunit epsilon [Thiotrichales bacterium 24-47-4]OZA19100.1 MAG: F0F1 ATP synthase subunit epsilon [Thiotrichales bacterium 17-46-47]OZA98389.1 MAG: F0F1 ATP synthase subunit epsilon [Thiotrichales bacterium 34-46-19]OZB8